MTAFKFETCHSSKNHKYYKAITNYKITEIYSENNYIFFLFHKQENSRPSQWKICKGPKQNLILNQVNHDEIFIYRCM
jgi:hypothetical protein